MKTKFVNAYKHKYIFHHSTNTNSNVNTLNSRTNSALPFNVSVNSADARLIMRGGGGDLPFSQVLRLLPRIATFGTNSPLRLIYRVFYVIASECKARAWQSASIKGDFILWIATNLHRYALQILAMTSGRICHEFKHTMTKSGGFFVRTAHYKFKAFFIKMTNAKFRVIASKKERKRIFAWQSTNLRYGLPRSLRSLAMTAHSQHIFISLPQIFLFSLSFY